MASTRTRATAALVAALGVIALSPASFAQDTQVADKGGRGEMRQHRMMEFRQDAGGDGIYRLAGIVCGPSAADRLETRLDRIAKRLELTEAQQPLFAAFRTSALTAQTSFADACAAARPGDRADLAGTPPGHKQAMKPGMKPGDKMAMKPGVKPDDTMGAPGADADAAPKTLELDQLKKGGDHARDRAERPDRADRASRAERPDLIAGIQMRLAVDKARIEAMEAVLPDLKALLASLTDAQKAKLLKGVGGGFGRGAAPEFHRGTAGGLDG